MRFRFAMGRSLPAGTPMPSSEAREEGGMLRWALNTGCLTLLLGAVWTGSAVDRLSRLVVIEDLSFPMNVESPLLDLCMNHDCMEGWDFRRILHLSTQFR